MNPYRRYLFPFAYDRFMDREPMTSARSTLLARARGRVLNVGFGTGLDLTCFGDAVDAVVGLDRNPGMFLQSLQRAAATRFPTTVVMADAQRLPFGRAEFDTVVTTFTLCSIDDVRAAIGEIRRVLRPDGRYLFIEHGMGADRPLRWWQQPVKALQWLCGDGCRIDRDVPALIRAGGFRLDSLEAVGDGGWPVLGQAWSGSARP